MTDSIRFRRTSTPGKVPNSDDFANNDIALNTHDGKMYMKTDSNSVVEIGGGGGGVGCANGVFDTPPWEEGPQIGESANYATQYNDIVNYDSFVIAVPERTELSRPYPIISGDHGDTWEVIESLVELIDNKDTLFGVVTFNAVARNKSNTYIMAGDFGTVFRSQDDGYTWESLPSSGGSTFPNLTINTIDVTSGPTPTWIVGGNQGVALRSTNDGDTWDFLPNSLNSGAPDTANIRSIANQGGSVWLAMVGEGYASRSTDDGVTWTELPRGLNSGSTTVGFNSVDMANGRGFNNTVAVGGSGRASISNDYGATWSGLPRGLNSGGGSDAKFQSVTTNMWGDWVAVANNGWASISNDDGVTWLPAPRGLNTGNVDANFTVCKYSIDIGSGYRAFACAEDGFVSMTEAGLFVGQERGYGLGDQVGNIINRTAVSGSTWISVGNNNYITVSQNSGNTWTDADLPYDTDYNWVGVDTNDDGVWVIVSDDGYALRSDNNGLSFVNLPRGLNSGLFSAHFRDLSCDKSGVWIAMGNGGWASRSSDNGITWTALPNGLNTGSTWLSAITNDWNGTWVAVSLQGWASRSDDGGLTWTGLPQGLNSGRNSAQFFSISTDRNGVFIAIAGYDDPSAVGADPTGGGWASRSDDGGLTWTGLPQYLLNGNVPTVFYNLNRIVNDGSSKWVVAGDNGSVFTSTDKGVTWWKQSNNLISPTRPDNNMLSVFYDRINAFYVGYNPQDATVIKGS